MKTATFYSELFDSVPGYVTEYNMFIIQSVATCSALTWLLFRAWQTLWKPVPELISILGIEVPDPPEVSLAGIKNDSVTLHWSKPDPQKPIVKYLIQINGLNVGETSKLETAITVTGLRPVHYYNIRVISVGSNNLQAGSLVIRLCTYDKNGRPVLNDGFKFSGTALEGSNNNSIDDISNNDNGVCLQASSHPEALPIIYREINVPSSSTRNSNQRRNTEGIMNGRKNSLELNSVDSMAPSMQSVWRSNESMHQLIEKLESINNERDRIVKEMTKDGEDFKVQFTDLCNERDKKKIILKEKEEASERLKKEVNLAEKLNRQAQMKKSQKGKLLKEKLAKRSKMKKDMIRWKKEIEDMKLERGQWRGDREIEEKKKQADVAELKKEIKQYQSTLNTIEEEIRFKGSQIKRLEKDLKILSDLDHNEESRLRDERDDLEWEITEKALTAKLNTKSQQLRELTSSLHQQQDFLSKLQHNSSMIFQGSHTGVDHDNISAQIILNSESNQNPYIRPISPILCHSMFGSSLVPSGAFSGHSPAFAPGPCINMGNECVITSTSECMDNLTDEDYLTLTADAPLSPTATSLLPSNIFADDDPPTPLSKINESPIPGPSTSTPLFNTPDSQLQFQSNYSPSAMTKSLNFFQNLPIYRAESHESVENDRSSQYTSPSPSLIATESPKYSKNFNNKGFRDLFLVKSRAKDAGQDGLASDLTRLSHSNTFPQLLDEGVAASGIKHRRINFPSGWTGFLNRASTTKESLLESNAHQIISRTPNTQRNALSSMVSRADESDFQDPHPSSPHIRSVLSFDFPCPSTDSAPFGWDPVQGNSINRNSLLSTNWSPQSTKSASNQSQTTWPSKFSKVTNFKHGLDTTFSSRLAFDDFLPPSEALSSQSTQTSIIGTIGTRQKSLHQTVPTPKLNPAAPVFEKFCFKTLSEPEKENNDKIVQKSLSEIKISSTSSQPKINQPLALRNSRELDCISSQSKVLEFDEKIDHQSDEISSDLASGLNVKEREESSFQRLLRKGSSSKFSISPFRSKDVGLFSGKKPTLCSETSYLSQG